MLRNDRNHGGDGVAMFSCSNILFMRANFIGIKCVAVHVKLSNSWITFVGPSVTIP